MSNNFKSYASSTVSKLADLKIKLYGYSFTHSSERFAKYINRGQLEEKLEALINKSNSKSGAYLITGFRGVGKSSLINNLIAKQQYPKKTDSTVQNIIILGLFISFVFQFFNLTLEQGICNLYFIFILILSSLSLFYLSKSSSSFTTFPKTIIPFYYFKYILHYLNVNYNSESKTIRILSQLVFAFISMYIAYGVVSLIFISNPIILNTKFVFVLFIISLAILFIVWLIVRYRFGIILNIQKRLTNFRKVFIHINLGHDELQVIDIFKQIAYNLKENYKKHINISQNKIIAFTIKIIFTLILFKISVVVFKLNNTYNFFIDDFYSNYFPSQNTKPTREKSVYESLNYLYNTNNELTALKYQEELLGNILKDLNYTNTRKNICYIIKIDPYIQPIRNTIDKLEISIKKTVEELEANKKDISNLQKLTIKFDFVVNVLYNNILSDPLFKGKKTSNNPKVLNYSAISLFIILFIIVILLSNIPIFAPRRRIYKKILKLIEQIESEINVSNGATFQFKSQQFDHRKSNQYKQADTKEIERSLIEIIDSIRQLPFVFQRSELIFIFDELDKLETNPLDSGKDSTISSLYSPEGTRERQKNVFKVLSNLKYFLNTAKAKFIFIAGREIHDAALADIADRYSFLSSIFHDEIYVPSILYKNLNESQVSKSLLPSFIEQYVCNQLIPYGYIKDSEKANLQIYEKYLKRNFKTLDDEDSQKAQWEKIIAKQKREKIIYSIYQLINYLSYISNGSSKKMVSHFEDFIRVAEKDESAFFSEPLDVKYNFIGKIHNGFKLKFLKVFSRKRYFIVKGELYLHISSDQQYMLSMINHLNASLSLKQSTLSVEYNDKLQVQSSYLIDHLFKFHRQAFTKSSLEVIPEMIDINKSPDLRGFIFEIINNLSKNHLDEIHFNLTQYRFNKLITQEMNYLSKVSEEASAAFNFSLDESITLKKHFEGLISKYCKEEGELKLSTNTNTVAGLYAILGDLHFHDEQFENAIRYYMLTYTLLKQTLINYTDSSSTNNSSNDTASFFYLKMILKIGLTFEKRLNYETALSYYNEGINYVQRNINSTRCLLELSRLSYQPILAKLFLLEKFHAKGALPSDFIDAKKNFKAIFNNSEKIKKESKEENESKERRPVFYSDFYYKLGILSFYKNSNDNKAIEYTEKALSQILGINKFKKYTFIEKLEKLLNEKDYTKKPDYHNLRYLSRITTFYADLLLSKFKYNEEEFKKFFESDIKNLNPTSSDIEFIAKYYILAGDISKIIGDDKYYRWSYSKLLLLYRYTLSTYKNKKSENSQQESVQQTSKQKIGESKPSQKADTPEVVSSIENQSSSSNTNLNEETFIKNINYIFAKISSSNYSSNDNVPKIEIEFLKKVFNNYEVSLKRTTACVDIEESIVAILNINLDLLSINDKNFLNNSSINSVLKNFETTPYCLGSTLYNRIIWLKYRLRTLYIAIQIIGIPKELNGLGIKDVNSLIDGIGKEFDSKNRSRILKYLNFKVNDEKNVELTQVLEYILSDALYCCNEILKLAESYGYNKIFNYLFFSKMNKIMLYWTTLHNNYCQYNEEKKKSIINYLNTLKDNQVDLLSLSYYKEQSLKNYYFALDSHNRGIGYLRDLNDLFYLNDDYCDRYYLYNIAIERFVIKNSETVGVMNDFRQKTKPISKTDNNDEQGENRIYLPEFYYTTILDKVHKPTN